MSKYLLLKFQSKECHIEIFRIIKDFEFLFSMMYHYFSPNDHKDNTQENVAGYLGRGTYNQGEPCGGHLATPPLYAVAYQLRVGLKLDINRNIS